MTERNPKKGNQLDEELQPTGVTINVISVSNIKSEIDGGQLYIRINCKDKLTQTKRKPNDRQTVIFNQNFFYNSSKKEVIDDDISFELYCVIDDEGASRNLLSSSKDKSKSKMNFYQGKLIGATKVIKFSRLNREKEERTFDIFSEDTKVVGKIRISYEYLERQEIVGGIKCPNLSLKPDRNIRSPLTLQNKYAAYKNLYSFLDGNQTPNCQFFPKKFKH